MDAGGSVIEWYSSAAHRVLWCPNGVDWTTVGRITITIDGGYNPECEGEYYWTRSSCSYGSRPAWRLCYMWIRTRASRREDRVMHQSHTHRRCWKMLHSMEGWGVRPKWTIGSVGTRRSIWRWRYWRVDVVGMDRVAVLLFKQCVMTATGYGVCRLQAILQIERLWKTRTTKSTSLVRVCKENDKQ